MTLAAPASGQTAGATTSEQDPPASPPVRWRQALVDAVVVTLLRPEAWLLGLAGFLAGGGVLLVGAPVAVLPTPSGLQNALGGPISTLVVGTPSTALIVLIVASVGAAAAAVIVGTVAGAWAERSGVLLTLATAREERLLDPPDLAGGPGTARVAAVRLLSLLPVALAAGLAWPPLYDAAYRELVLPGDLTTPLPIRIIRAVPGPLAAVVAAWLAADSAAALGVRRVLLGRHRVLAAWALGWVDLVRHPLRAAGTALFGLGALVLLLGPMMLAATTGWARVREVMLGDAGPVAAVIAVGVWVAVWLAALLLAGIASAIRVAAWTLAVPGATGNRAR